MIWKQQWELFSPNFKEGKAHIDLTSYGFSKILQLYPGPGFGDFSHPTTRLVLRLMSSLCSGRFVVDVGCGSGILSFAAAAMGASQVYGYDIDPEAVLHSQMNLDLSPDSSRIVFSTNTPQKIPENSLILMNMIECEQQMAWASLDSCLTHPATLVTSGILTPDSQKYLNRKKPPQWQLLQVLQEDEWSAFVFSYTP